MPPSQQSLGRGSERGTEPEASHLKATSQAKAGLSPPQCRPMPPRLPANLVVSSHSRPSLAAWSRPSFPRPDMSPLSSPSSLFPVKLLGEWGGARAAETTSLKRQVQWQCPSPSPPPWAPARRCLSLPIILGAIELLLPPISLSFWAQFRRGRPVVESVFIPSAPTTFTFFLHRSYF